MTNLTDQSRQAQASAAQALEDLRQLVATTEAAEKSLGVTLARAQREASLVENVDKAALRAFLDKPYLTRPLGEGQYELIVPTFVGFRAGWPVRHTDAYSVFLVSRFIHFINPLPDWLAQELEFGAPSFQAALDGNLLTVTKGDPAAVFEKLGGSRAIARRDGEQLYLRPASRFDILRRIIRDEGFLPFTPTPIPAELRRAPEIARDEQGRPAFALRPHQARDYERFLETGALSVFAYPQTGKSFVALQACAALAGPKLILGPRRALCDQWRARIDLYLTPEAASEVVVDTFQGARKHLDRDWSLVVFDEAHHIPADFAIETANLIRAVARLGLSATPRREDGNEDLIPALCGFPVGADWPVAESQRPRVTVWIVKDEAAKLRHMARLCERPVDGKTFVFTRLIALGEQAARRLGVPFVYGKTRRPLDVIRDNETVVISSVGDEGLSFPVRRIVEIDFLYGSGMQAGQRLGRLAYEIEGKHHPGEHHVLMTPDEYRRFAKRLLIYEQWGLEVDVRAEAGGASEARAAQPRRTIARKAPKPAPRRRAAQAEPASEPLDEAGRALALPAVAVKIERAISSAPADVAGNIRRVFRMCFGAAFTPAEIVEGLGLAGGRTIDRYRAACKALLAVGLLAESEAGRYTVNQGEILRLQALARAVRNGAG